MDLSFVRARALPPPICSGQLSADAHVRAALKSSRHHPHQSKGTKPILLPEIGQEMPADNGGAKRLVRNYTLLHIFAKFGLFMK